MPEDTASVGEMSQEIRLLIVREGLTVAETSERLGLPEPVIDAWLEQQNDVQLAEPEAPEESEADEAGHSEEAAEGIGEHWSDAAVYRCSHCRDVVAQVNAESHEEKCLRGTDWSKLAE